MKNQKHLESKPLSIMLFAGLINAVFWLVYALFQVVGGFAADKYSPHKLITIGLVGAIIAKVIY